MRDELEMNKKQTQMSRKSLFTTPPQKLTPPKVGLFVYTLLYCSLWGGISLYLPLWKSLLNHVSNHIQSIYNHLYICVFYLHSITILFG